MDIFIILLISVGLISIYLYNTRELRSTKCNKCESTKLGVFELNTDLHPDLKRASNFHLIFNPNKYITKVQCTKCGNIQDFTPLKKT